MTTLSPMMRTGGGRVAVGVSLLAVLTLAGCAVSSDTPPGQLFNQPVGQNVNVPFDAMLGDQFMAVRNAVAVVDGDTADTASLVVTLVNQALEADVLESASLEGDPLVLSGGPIEFQPGQSVGIGFDENATATQQPFGVGPGNWVDITLNFTRAGTAELQILVVPDGDEYVPVQSP